MKKGYDNVSWFYDRLSFLMFGKQLLLSQQWLLSFVDPNTHLLVVGGGSGWVLDALSALRLDGLHVTYVDASPKMIDQAKKRNMGSMVVTFIPQPVESVLLQNHSFDVIITPYFFDNFSTSTAAALMQHLSPALKIGGSWLYVDFQEVNSLKSTLLLRCMFLFFRLLCGIEARKLHHILPLFKEQRYSAVAEKVFMDGFVKAVHYKKTE